MPSFATAAERTVFNSHLNENTLKIAASTNHKRIILYVWIAINKHIHAGNHRPTFKQLGTECNTKAENVRDAVLFLQDNGYLKVTTDLQRRRQYDLI